MVGGIWADAYNRAKALVGKMTLEEKVRRDAHRHVSQTCVD
jgi:hypothetical protein